ncbi:hypothetical protein PRIPAC_98144 [Pristionchus pacificus]|uniref:Uncharacterized protein n=1 Tax=Pristionchus pacificus TaxID=54126 RepID=A0A2A6CCX4_PRIPA|nr:hypothetical protein PRIPAC_98144 [Pristionchus pacificus]|eukprot:PDM75893.1 hypothetical protein PRIPAC_43629 [Pristionchus pacificus]
MAQLRAHLQASFFSGKGQTVIAAVSLETREGREKKRIPNFLVLADDANHNASLNIVTNGESFVVKHTFPLASLRVVGGYNHETSRARGHGFNLHRDADNRYTIVNVESESEDEAKMEDESMNEEKGEEEQAAPESMDEGEDPDPMNIDEYNPDYDLILSFFE